MRNLILCAAMIAVAAPMLAAEPAPAGFEALDANATVNLKRGMTRQVFGPMLHETEETVYSNEPILALRVIVSITKPLAGCEASTEPRCKTSTAYVETENIDASQLGFRTKPAFGWTVESVEEYPKGRPPDCILIRLQEDVRSGGPEETAACVTDIIQLHTAEFNGDITLMSDAERAVARKEPVVLSKPPGAAWSVGFVESDPRSKTCKISSLIPACRTFVVGLVSDGQGKDFAFRSPLGFGMKVADIMATPQCLMLTFEEQQRRAGRANTDWPRHSTMVCVSPEGFVPGK